MRALVLLQRKALLQGQKSLSATKYELCVRVCSLMPPMAAVCEGSAPVVDVYPAHSKGTQNSASLQAFASSKSMVDLPLFSLTIALGNDGFRTGDMEATDNAQHEYWTNETHEINPASTDSLQDAGLHHRELQRQPRE